MSRDDDYSWGRLSGARYIASEQGRKPYRYEGDGDARFGSLTLDGDRIVCHVCRRSYRNLEPHLRAAHQMTNHDYRIEFGIPMRVQLWSPDLLRAASERTRLNGGAARLRKGLLAMTPEERSRRARHASEAAYREARRFGLPRVDLDYRLRAAAATYAEKRGRDVAVAFLRSVIEDLVSDRPLAPHGPHHRREQASA